MKLTPKQQEIIQFAQANGGQITSKQVQATFGGRYYWNDPKHLGAILSRMVNAGLLKREKPGVFVVGGGNRYKKNINQNQLLLFEQ